MPKPVIESVNPLEEKTISERLGKLLSPYGIESVLSEEYASMDITLVDSKTKSRICSIEVETKPQKYSFDMCYPYPHPLWITTDPLSSRGWSFLYRKIMKLTKDPRGRELVRPDDLYVICDHTCDKLYVATFGDIRDNCKLVKFSLNDYEDWYVR
jgi:hypothetical protein